MGKENLRQTHSSFSIFGAMRFETNEKSLKREVPFQTIK